MHVISTIECTVLTNKTNLALQYTSMVMTFSARVRPGCIALTSEHNCVQMSIQNSSNIRGFENTRVCCTSALKPRCCRESAGRSRNRKQLTTSKGPLSINWGLSMVLRGRQYLVHYGLAKLLRLSREKRQ